VFVVVSASWYTLSMTEDNPKHLSPPIAALQTEHERDWEDLRIVTGFLPWIDTLPETASKHGLPCRVAVIFNHSGVPHSRLYWDLVDAFVGSLNSDSVIFEIDTGGVPLIFTSVDMMHSHVMEAPERFGIPFSRATFFVAGRVTAFIDTEYWAQVGGPFPYSDSWTFSIYRSTNTSMKLQDECYQVCTRHDHAVLDEMRGLPSPEPLPLWRRLLKWLVA